MASKNEFAKNLKKMLPKKAKHLMGTEAMVKGFESGNKQRKKKKRLQGG